MTEIKIVVLIKAPVGLVFQSIADSDKYLEAVPEVTKVEYFTDQKSGVGTRFISTRITNGKESATELLVTEHIHDRRVRMVNDSHGVIWDTIFEFEDESGITRLTLTMLATPHKFLPKLMITLMKGMIRKNIERDMDCVKSYCEK